MAGSVEKFYENPFSMSLPPPISYYYCLTLGFYTITAAQIWKTTPFGGAFSLGSSSGLKRSPITVTEDPM